MPPPPPPPSPSPSPPPSASPLSRRPRSRPHKRGRPRPRTRTRGAKGRPRIRRPSLAAHRRPAPTNVWSNWQTRAVVFPKRPHLTLSELDAIPYTDEAGARISVAHEREEQYVSHDFIEPHNVVLELGARYGVVSAVINNKLEHPERHVCVEPDATVLSSLAANRESHNSHFHIVHGIVSRTPMGLRRKGYASHLVPVGAHTPAVPTHTVESLQRAHGLVFDTLVADCEGCLCAFAEENPRFVFHQLRNIMFEADLPKTCDYAALRRRLRAAGFRPVVGGFVSFWRRAAGVSK